MKEIERKYVARLVGSLPVHEQMRIEQSYIFVCKSFEWRVRLAEYTYPKYEMWYATALKIGNGYIRGEYEIYIPRWVYRLLMLLVPKGTTIRKDRSESHGWSVDRFSHQFEGLVLAEYETKDAAASRPPVPSGLKLVRDVTDDGRFANKRLSRMAAHTRYAMLRAVASW